uniref:Gag polyprotein n=27 Tax=Equine infectious anemia virus TaxID=11665 RepID=K7WBM4_9RETR|nr:gag polyprotein [Equine infectious anemia virus]AFW99176.1 gag polyprotein [Equine infectious anemia virus]
MGDPVTWSKALKKLEKVTVQGSQKLKASNCLWALSLVDLLHDTNFSKEKDWQLRDILPLLEDVSQTLTGQEKEAFEKTWWAIVAVKKGLQIGHVGDGRATYQLLKAKYERAPSKKQHPEPQEEYPIMIDGAGNRNFRPLTPRGYTTWVNTIQQNNLLNEASVNLFGILSVDCTSEEMNAFLDVVPGQAGQKQVLLDLLDKIAQDWDNAHPLPNAPMVAPPQGPIPMTARFIRGLGVPRERQMEPAFDQFRQTYRQWIIEAMTEGIKIMIGKPKAQNIRQGPKEPYPDFVDRLLSQVKSEGHPSEITKFLTDTLTIQNANEECKAAMRHLRPEDTLEEKLYACRDIGTTKQKMMLLARALQSGLAGSMKGGICKGGPLKAPQTCYNCGKPGHLSSQCRAPKVCFKCKQPGHFSKQCRNAPKNGKQGAQGRPQKQTFPIQQKGQQMTQQGGPKESQGLYPDLTQMKQEYKLEKKSQEEVEDLNLNSLWE